MGGMIAQELALSYPEKVNKLILYASYCGGNESKYTSNPEVIETFSDISGVTCNILLRSASLMFPKKWRVKIQNIPIYLITHLPFYRQIQYSIKVKPLIFLERNI